MPAIGMRADGLTALPPATFDYAVSDPPDNLDVSAQLWSSLDAPSAVMDNDLVELLDRKRRLCPIS